MHISPLLLSALVLCQKTEFLPRPTRRSYSFPSNHQHSQEWDNSKAELVFFPGLTISEHRQYSGVTHVEEGWYQKWAMRTNSAKEVGDTESEDALRQKGTLSPAFSIHSNLVGKKPNHNQPNQLLTRIKFFLQDFQNLPAPNPAQPTPTLPSRYMANRN